MDIDIVKVRQGGWAIRTSLKLNVLAEKVQRNYCVPRSFLNT